MELLSCAAPLCCMAANCNFSLSSDVTLVDSVEMWRLSRKKSSFSFDTPPFPTFSLRYRPVQFLTDSFEQSSWCYNVRLKKRVFLFFWGSITQVATFELYSFHHSLHIADLYPLPVSDPWCPLQVKGHTPGQMSISEPVAQTHSLGTGFPSGHWA